MTAYRVWGIALLLGTALLGAHGARAVSPADKCEAAKNKTAGKYAACLQVAVAKAIKKGGAPDYSKCDAKFSEKWTSAESAGAGMCPSNGDLASMQTRISACADGIAACLNGTCPICGNGAIDAGEDCDQANFGGETCVTQGFAGGMLVCGSGCTFDTASCWNMRFTDNADGTITDNDTGLMWEKKTGGADVTNLHAAYNSYQWSGLCTVNTSKYCQPTTAAATLCAANAEGGTTGCDECTGGDGTCDATETVWTWAVALNAASFAGHSDWRIPKRLELEGILDLAAAYLAVGEAFQGASCGVPCTDVTDPDCSCTGPGQYWSASTYVPFAPAVWVVSVNDGGVQPIDRNFPYYSGFYVRAVRAVS